MQIVDADGAANVALVTTAETVVATVSGVSPAVGGRVIISGNAQITTGAGTTSVQMRVRRGSTAAGAQVGTTVQEAIGAAVPFSPSIQVDDLPGETVSGQYSLTAQQVGATGNGTCVASNISAEF